ncbi:MAG: hypothetical protein KGD59_00890 [Candidatus Heimdallarchaeota archaeon]|nr:hypothetical protein [Candidatus Heimdallarchaeota archaeon]MBY8993074.1 hypothetical protein [Candidatus Heimdallarchaeota archaeon]
MVNKIINSEIIEEDLTKFDDSDQNSDSSYNKNKEKNDVPEIELDQLEADEAVGELFEKINPLTIPSVIVGIILLIISFTNILDGHPIGTIIVGFAGGLAFVFGCSELIIFGVKGIGQKLNWSQYFMGIIAAIGADSSDIVVVTILLTRAKKLSATGLAENIALANNLTLTSITLVLTTVLINTLILGVTMLVITRKKPFKLPQPLTNTESNLVLAMTIFSLILMVFGFTHNSLDIAQFDRAFEGVIGVALLSFYILFIVFMIGDAKAKSTGRIGPQTLITEYFPEENGHDKEKGDHQENRLKKFVKNVFGRNQEDEEGEQFVSLRRFPWYILAIAFIVGIAGIVFGGTMISDSIESGLSIFSLPILVYSVIVGFVSSAPEATITMRAILDPEKEDVEIGLVHQVSSINQTFFILFGFPFLFASIINVDIPVALDTTLVFTGIFVISLALHLTIIDDNHFDRVEGMLILLASITSLLALGVVGGLLN